MTGLQSLQNAVNHVPGREMKASSRLGDCYGKMESRKILEAASVGHDQPAKDLKAKTESLYSGSMYSAAPRYLKAKAAAGKVKHFSVGLDNVGQVSNNLYLRHYSTG